MDGRATAVAGVGRERQAEIYLGAVRGRAAVVPVNTDALERKARRAMSRQGFAYIAGGAGGESTMRANREAFEGRRIVPRVLKDVSRRDIGVELFSARLPTPLLLAPIGVLGVAHKEADVGVARAAAGEGVPMIFSNQASFSMEECSAVMGDMPRWFQLYWSSSDDLVASFVRRAENCGCGAIVVTLDTTLFGWRARDLDLAFLPFALGKGMAQYVSDPVFNGLVDEAARESADTRDRITVAAVRALVELARTYPGSFWQNLRSPRPRAAVRLFLDAYSRASLTWNDLRFLRGLTKLPILLKGILAAEDARTAIEHGVDGIVVSNHGGRQIDGAVAALDALPAVVEEVGERVPVLFDSGIRGGADVFKALALGARAVLLGRLYAYGLGIAGERGVRDVIRNVCAEFDLTMGLAGCASVSEITPDRVVQSGAGRL